MWAGMRQAAWSPKSYRRCCRNSPWGVGIGIDTPIVVVRGGFTP
jgi:hypothetical protein